jgi:DNA-binding NarL/FixJ family response regulator
MASKATENGTMRVVIVDDDADTLLLFRDILTSAPGFEHVGDFSSTGEALIGIPRLQPDLAVIDIFMPGLDGMECTKLLKRAMPRLKIVIITGSHSTDAVSSSLRVGADAFLIKPLSADQFLATLRFAYDNKTEINQNEPRPARRIPSMAPSESCLPLNSRENEVLKGFADGLLYKEISDKLGISYAAVHKCQHTIFQKLHVENRSEAVRLWFMSGGQ